MRWVIASAVEKLPPDVKAILELIAVLQGRTLDDVVTDLAQKWYDVATNGD
jgi:hypothetical protein